MRTNDVVVFDPPPSDLPYSVLNGLSWEEMLVIFNRRYRQAGEPQDKLRGWLNDHYIGAKSHDPLERIYQCDWFAMSSLLRAAQDWAEEKVPPRSDLA